MLWVAIAIVAWGLWAVFEKLAVQNMSPLLVQLTSAYVYSAFAPIMYLAMKARNVNFDWNTKGVIWTTAAVTASTTACYAFLYAIQHRPANVVVAWTQTYPVVSLFLCWLVLGESLTWSKLLGAFFIIMGAVFMGR